MLGMTFPFPVTTSQRRIERKNPTGLKKITPQQTSEYKTNNDSSYEKNNYNPVEKKTHVTFRVCFCKIMIFHKILALTDLNLKNLRSPNLSHIFKFLAGKKHLIRRKQNKTMIKRSTTKQL